MDLDVNESVLIPRTDTEVLAEQAIGFVKTLDEPRVLDLCAGTGQLGIEALSRDARQCVFIDQRNDAVKLIRTSAAAA